MHIATFITLSPIEIPNNTGLPVNAAIPNNVIDIVNDAVRKSFVNIFITR